MLTQVQYDNVFKNYAITSCVIVSKNEFGFISVSYPNSEDDDEESITDEICFIRYVVTPEKVIIPSLRGVGGALMSVAVTNFPSKQAIGFQENEYYTMQLGSLDRTPKAIPSEICETDIKKNYDFSDYVKGKKKWPLLSKPRGFIYIDGDLYAVSFNRSVAVQVAENEWKNLVSKNDLDVPTDKTIAGFESIDGFNKNDLYAVGGKSDLWHFNGQQWRQIQLPTNIDMFTVCCAGDGYVYLGGTMGTIWYGRDDKWQLLDNPEFTIPYRNMVWYQDRVWCTSDYGLWCIKNQKLFRPSDVPDEVLLCSGSLSVGDGCLLIAGSGGAQLFDGEKWTDLLAVTKD
jgi:hypothetical protein